MTAPRMPRSSRSPSRRGAETVVDGRRARRLANRERIISAARVMIAEGGVDQLSMRALADRAEVSVTTLYNLFETREAIVRAARDQVLAEVAPLTASLGSSTDLGDLRDRLVALLDEVMNGMSRALLLALMDDTSTDVRFFVEHRATGNVAPHLRSACARGELSASVDLQALQEAIEAVVATAGRLWSRGLIDAEDRRRRMRSGIELVLLAHATARGRRSLLGAPHRRVTPSSSVSACG